MTEALFGGASEWQPLLLEEADDDKQAELRATRDYFRDELAAVLAAENLVILSGLGTSLSINGAPSMSALWADLRRLKSFKKISSTLNPRITATENFEHVLSDAHARFSIDQTNGDLSQFIAEAEQLVLTRCSFIQAETDLTLHEAFLRKVARRSTRLQRAQVFTTNYDKAFEQAAQKARFNIIDGFGFGGVEFDGASFDLDFVRRRPNEQPALEPSVFHLLKLHGSVDWDGSTDIIRRVAQTPKQPVLIYPSAEKYQLAFRQPFLEFMSRFQIALRQPDVGVVIVGFGFNDEHLVAPIRAALTSNIGLRAVVVDPSLRSDTRNASFDEIERLIKLGDRRLALLNGTFEDLVTYLPDVPKLEERDAHLDRIRSSGEGS
jgi:hypothetical protein